MRRRSLGLNVLHLQNILQKMYGSVLLGLFEDLRKQVGSILQTLFLKVISRIENIYGDPENIPEVWDMIFWGNAQYEHVWIVLEANSTSFKCINQNVWNADGEWADDAVIITEYDYKNVAGWYRYKKFFAEIHGIPTFIRQEQPSDSMTRNGAFIPSEVDGKKYWGPYFIFYPHFWTFSEKKRNAIKEHEYAHYIYFENMTDKERKAWENMSNLPTWARLKHFVRTWIWYKNGYVNEYAKKKETEDFAECWEYYILNGERYNNGETFYENQYVMLKIQTVVKAMKKYTMK